MANQEFAQIDQIIQRNLKAFQKDGALTVRPGYKITGDWVTSKPAIVVTVKEKKDVPGDQQLPAKIEGVPVDVRQASPVELLRLANPDAYRALLAQGRKELTIAEFPQERLIATGEPVTPGPSAAEIEAEAKPQIKYTPAPGVQLDEVNEEMSITCHASPDAGWPTLKAFLTSTNSSLTVGMYDFTSGHILQTLEATLGARGELTLTLDNPPKNPSADQTDEETVTALAQTMKNRFAEAWALVRSDKAIQKWIFPTAYHIKVAVKDSSSFWLSSGNWNNSNQPDFADPAHPTSNELTKADRDWHVVVENQTLAQIFEAFLKHDFQIASSNQSGVGAQGFAIEEVLPEIQDIEALAAKPRRLFKPLDIQNKKIRIQPILTPDNYATQVLKLIESAKSKFYMQTQYIHPSDKDGDQDFMALIEAVKQKIADGLDVRLITSQFQAQGGWLEKLQEAGVDLSVVRIQNRVHNKGIVVDSGVVMLGSHNWSADGTLRNRDASLIVFDAEAASYYEQIFVQDWTTLAKQSLPTPVASSRAAKAGRQ